MKGEGSVLIVVLGLLAILAIVGLAMVTMSNIDRNTAENFALQTQMNLTAEAAVDYVSHSLVQSVWELNSTGGYTGKLLTGTLQSSTGQNGATVLWDLPNGGVTNASACRPWLARLTDNVTDPGGLCFSYQVLDTPGNTSNTRYGIAMRTRAVNTTQGDALPQNLGYYTSAGDGVWIPDLATPFEYGIVRASVTVIDHASMINVNAHGNGARDTTFGASGNTYCWVATTGQSYSSAQGFGFFVSDVKPSWSGTTLDPTTWRALLVYDGTSNYGRWPSIGGPTNVRVGEILIENPSLALAPPAGLSWLNRTGGADHPYTLDEEFELRKLSGTYWQSRLERAFPTAFDCTPATTPTQTKQNNRMTTTTVGWTAQVRGDFGATHAMVVPNGFTSAQAGWSMYKPDLNIDPVAPSATITDSRTIRQTLLDCRVFASETNQMSQFLANLDAFRAPDTVQNLYTRYTRASDSMVFVGARRQPIFNQASFAYVTNTANQKIVTIQIQVCFPWKGEKPGITTGFTWPSTVNLRTSANTTLTLATTASPFMLTSKPVLGQGGIYSVTLTGTSTSTTPTPTADLKTIQIEYQNVSMLPTAGGWVNNTLILDWIRQVDGDMAIWDTCGSASARFMYRPCRFDMDRRTASPTGTDVVMDGTPSILYVRNWKASPQQSWQTTLITTAGTTDMPIVDPAASQGTSTHPDRFIPIRFPNSANINGNMSNPPAPYNVNVTASAGNPGSFPPVGRFQDPVTGQYYYKALPRVGDLNQVLCPSVSFSMAGGTGPGGYWPWLPRLARLSSIVKDTPSDPTLTEATEKWDWADTTAPITRSATPPTLNVSRTNAAWCFSVGGPWNDGIDNDGDGYADLTGVTFFPADTGQDPIASPQSGGRYGGPENRVAGLINLNTATAATKRSVEAGLGLTAGDLDVYFPAATYRPFISPAENMPAMLRATPHSILSYSTAMGSLECREEPFTRLTNILTCRSDTYSVYGSVQFVVPPSPGNLAAPLRVVKTRRFWALIDRSPSLAYCPYDSTSAQTNAINNVRFIHPRVLNFQWLDTYVPH